MSFSADWLSLRRPADLRARDAGLATALAEWAAARRGPLAVLDLGAGTGANMAATSALLGAEQHWRLVDNDARLLARASAPAGATCEAVVADLAKPLAPLFDPAPDLVTASAFFDLCGAALIDRLIEQIVSSKAAFYTVLTYDGRETWSPPHPSDQAVLAAFHADQQTDKGLGAALGPQATAYLETRFTAAGYTVRTASSDWQLAHPDDADLIGALAAGSAAATEPRLGQEAADWGTARAKAGDVMIGHLDMIALPPR